MTDIPSAEASALRLLAGADRRIDWALLLRRASRIENKDTREERLAVIMDSLDKIRAYSLIADLAVEQPWRRVPNWSGETCDIIRRHDKALLIKDDYDGGGS